MTQRNQVWAACPQCGWTWIVYGSLPAPALAVADRMKHARCPNCPTSRKPVLPEEGQIVAAEIALARALKVIADAAAPRKEPVRSPRAAVRGRGKRKSPS